MNTDQINQRYYGLIGSDTGAKIAQGRVHWLVKNSHGPRVLDAGCSQGIAALLLAREGFEVLGIDIEHSAVDFALAERSRESESVAQRLSFEVGDLTEDLKAKYGAFDTILFGEVIEHLAHPENVLANLANALKPGGIVLLTTPYGLHEFHDHKQTFFASNLIQTVGKHFSITELEVVDGYLRAKLVQGVTGQLSNKEIMDILEASEQAYLKLQRSTNDREAKFRERIQNQIKQISKLQAQGLELKEFIQSFQKRTSAVAWAQVDRLAKLINERDVEISSTKKQVKQLAQSESDLNRCLNSISYKLGNALVLAVKKPGKQTALLPFRIGKLLLNWTQAKGSQWAEPESKLVDLKSSNPKHTSSIRAFDSSWVFFVPVNGAGLGHLTRCLAVARRLKKLNPELNIGFFTTCSAISILSKEGFAVYHLPSKQLLGEWIDTARWNEFLEHNLTSVLSAYRAATVVFDGPYPYAGLKKSFKELSGISKIWIKRGLYRNEKISDQIESHIGHFDSVIVPGEMNNNDSSNDNPKLSSVEPIVLLDPEQLKPRDEVRTELGLSKQARVAYVQLGAGNINDIHDLVQQVVSALNSVTNMQVVLGESIISNQDLEIKGEFIRLKDFPNSALFNGFDIAVMASGYNSVYESISLGLPTIFFPNLDTGADDQMARAKIAQDLGTASIMTTFDRDIFLAQVNSLLKENTNQALDKSSSSFINGATQAAEQIAKSIARLDNPSL